MESRRLGRLALPVGASLVFLIAHLLVLAPTPGSIDSVNFLLGVRKFDVAEHQPHPPGSPVFIALGKISRRVIAPAGQEPLERLKAETRALAVWSAILGSFAILPLLTIFRRLGACERRAWAATLLTVASPLFWMLSNRPLSDMTGLVAALAVQALVLVSLFDAAPVAPGGSSPSWRRHAATLAAVIAGLAVGIRTQTLFLTAPVLATAAVRLWRERRARAAALAAAFAMGVAACGVPLLIATGGLQTYLNAFAKQAAEQWHDEGILAASPTLHDLIQALARTLGSPFANDVLTVVAIGFALVGVAVMVSREKTAKILVLMYGPYLAFHVLFQDPGDGRYALPFIPALAYMIVVGFELAAQRFMPWMAAVMIAVCLLIAVPPAAAYSSNGNPLYRALAEMHDRAADDHETSARPVLGMHHAVARMLRTQTTSFQTFTSAPRKEWRALVNYWQHGGASRVWFLAEPGRTDLALIDPSSRRIVRSYAWPFDNRSLMTGIGPRGAVWHEIQPPGWMLDEGWSLTPETGGVAFADGRGPSAQPIRGFIRRRREAVTVLIGGRTETAADASPARIDVRLDGVLVDSWIEASRTFLRTWRIPAGRLVGTTPYALLEVRADASPPHARVVIDQFDAQPEDAVVYGFDNGWYELEVDAQTGLSWRWTDRTASLRIYSTRRDVIVRLVADRPPDDRLRPPQIVVRAEEEALMSRLDRIDAGLTVSFRVPQAALQRAHGAVTIQTVWPTAAHSTPVDANRPFPGLRVFDVSVAPADPEP